MYIYIYAVMYMHTYNERLKRAGKGAAGARHRGPRASPYATGQERPYGLCAAVFSSKAKQSSASSNSGYVHSVSPSSRPSRLSHGAPLQAPLSVPNTVFPCVCKAGWFKSHGLGGVGGGLGVGFEGLPAPSFPYFIGSCSFKRFLCLWSVGYIRSIKLFIYFFIYLFSLSVRHLQESNLSPGGDAVFPPQSLVLVLQLEGVCEGPQSILSTLPRILPSYMGRTVPSSHTSSKTAPHSNSSLAFLK